MKLCALFSRYSCVDLHVCELALPLWNKIKYLSWWKRWQSGVLIVAGNSRYSLETWPSHILSVRFIFEAVEKLLKIIFWKYAHLFKRYLSTGVANFFSLCWILHILLTTEVRKFFSCHPIYRVGQRKRTQLWVDTSRTVNQWLPPKFSFIIQYVLQE